MRSKNGIEYTKELREKFSLSRKMEWETGRRKGGWKLSQETKNKMMGRIPWNKGLRGFNSGEKHYNWKGGYSDCYRLRRSSDYRNWRRDVFVRDQFICKKCGITHTYITAHHIKSFKDYPDLRFNVDNGITLCEECHKKTDNYKGRGRKKWLMRN